MNQKYLIASAIGALIVVILDYILNIPFIPRPVMLFLIVLIVGYVGMITGGKK